jgi:LPXTG-motif cell wall-anchored protein
MNQKRILLAVLALGTAVSALAQVHSNAPTDKDYRLVIVSPSNGAAITGTDMTIVLGQPSLPSGRSVSEKERKDVMMPAFQIWVDGKDYGNLPAGQNVFTAHDLSYGPHKITVAAKNTAGELVERKEINVTTVTASSMTTQPQTDQVQPAAAPPAAVAAPAAPEPVQAQAPAPAPAPRASAPLASLPQTATSYPAAAVGGLALLIAGLALSRRRSS